MALAIENSTALPSPPPSNSTCRPDGISVGDPVGPMATTLDVLRGTIEDLIRFQSLLVLFAQQITPYVDTRDRDVAGLLRGLSGAINSVADELMKRSDAMLTRDRRHEMGLNDLEARLAALHKQLLTVQRGIEESNRT